MFSPALARLLIPDLDESSGDELARGPGRDVLKSYVAVHAVIEVENRKFHTRFMLMDEARHLECVGDGG